MKRREFLKGTAAGIGNSLLLTQPTRLYGTPRSISPSDTDTSQKFYLPLTRSGLPAETLGLASEVCHLWEKVLTDRGESIKFFNDPESYFLNAGITNTDQLLKNESVKMLHALSSPSFKNNLSDGDYQSAFLCIKSLGLIDLNPSPLRETLTKILSKNADDIKMSLHSIKKSPERTSAELFEFLKSSDIHVTETDLAAISEIMKLSVSERDLQPYCASCVAAVAIAATVVLYVSVVVGATVAIMAAVYISVAAMSAVTVSSSRPRPVPKGLPLSNPFVGNYVKLDKDAARNATFAVRIANASESPGLQSYVIKEITRLEIEAIVEALAASGLVKISKEAMPSVIDALTTYSCRAMGVAVKDHTL